jgi:hypothetical protein
MTRSINGCDVGVPGTANTTTIDMVVAAFGIDEMSTWIGHVGRIVERR